MHAFVVKIDRFNENENWLILRPDIFEMTLSDYTINHFSGYKPVRLNVKNII